MFGKQGKLFKPQELHLIRSFSRPTLSNKMKSEPRTMLSDEELKAKHPELYMLAKNFWRIYAKEIFNDPRNAHLRRAKEGEGE